MQEDLNDIVLFAQVARGGGISRAGEALDMPKATVSRRLAQFEQRLGVRLFEKSTRRMVLTEAGHAYLARCLPLLEELQAVRDFGSQLPERPSGHLRVSAPPDLCEHLLSDALASFCATYPEVVLELDLNARRVDLIAERVDVAIRAGSMADSSLVSRKLADMTRSLYGSPAYFQGTAMPQAPDALAQHRFVLLRGAQRVLDTETLSEGRRSLRLTWSTACVQVNSVVMQRAFVMAGLGLAALPDLMCESAMAAGQLVKVLPTWRLTPEAINVVTPSHRFVPRKTQVFIEHLFSQPIFRQCLAHRTARAR